MLIKSQYFVDIDALDFIDYREQHRAELEGVACLHVYSISVFRIGLLGDEVSSNLSKLKIQGNLRIMVNLIYMEWSKYTE